MLNERLASQIGPDRIDLAYESRGDPAHPTVLLIMGLSAQLIHWPEGFVDALVARALRVVRFDNRDAGRSSHRVHAPPADLPAALRGDLSSVTYTLSDMAADAVGLLDALGIPAAHLVGASMGAGIAQSVAIEHPSRVRSLTSMMWTTGAPGVGAIHPETMRALFGAPPPSTREEHVVRAVRAAGIVGSPAFPADPEELAARAGLAWDRDHDLAAVARQAVATIASGDRTARLRGLSVPTLVIHGLADTMCDPSGGRATAEAIPGAKLHLVEGMGHDLPRALWPTFVEEIVGLVQRGEAVAGGVATRG